MIKTVTDAPQENERLRIALTDPKYHVDAWDYGAKPALDEKNGGGRV
jgi:hypothetical protein